MTKEKRAILEEYEVANNLIEELDVIIAETDDINIEDWFIKLGAIREENIFKFTRDLKEYISVLKA